MFDFLKKLFGSGTSHSDGKPLLESTINITFDDNEVLCSRPNGVIEKITWDNLDAVVIETTDEGPFSPDVFWMLLSKDMESGCVFPQGATGEEALINEMQNRLPNFQNEMLLASMTSVENQKFLIWERST